MLLKLRSENKNKNMDIQQKYSDNRVEIEKLRLENVQLKKNLEREELLHRSLYKQWSELNARTSAKEQEEEQLKSRNSFYKYAFYVILILLLLIPAYYFLSNSKVDKGITSAPKTSSSQTPPTKQTSAKNQTVTN